MKELKTCCRCKIEKPHSEFNKDKQKRDGLVSYCRVCSKKQYRKFTDENPEYWANQHAKYRKKNYDRVVEYNRQYYQENKKMIDENKRIWTKERYDSDKLYKLRNLVRNSIYRGLQGQKSKRTVEILGCTMEEFSKYIESQFKEGMTWDNHTHFGWHIDHIIPLASAKTEEEVYKLNHYTNFQPLWWEENLKKSDKIFD